MKLLTTLVVAGVLAFGALAYGHGSSAGAGKAQAAASTLHFLLREELIPLDEGKQGPSDHERALLRGTLLDPKTRKPRGTQLGFCIAADIAQEERLVCQVVFTPLATRSLAAADQITMQTIFDNVQTSKPQRSAITGGTGRYAGVGGEIVAKPGPNNLVDVVFRLLR
jgi:hypothetical protein